LFARVGISVTEFPKKTAKKEVKNWFRYFLFKSGRAHPVFNAGNFYVFGRGKTNFFWGGYNFKTG